MVGLCRLFVDDPTLNRFIPPSLVASIPSSCAAPLYQRTTIQAVADMSYGDPTAALPDLELTDYVTFTSPMNGTAVAITGSVIEVCMVGHMIGHTAVNETLEVCTRAVPVLTWDAYGLVQCGACAHGASTT